MGRLKALTLKKQTAIDKYIESFPKEVQLILQRIKSTINKSAPYAEERISYNIPTFVINGKPLVHFAAFKKHIGFFPTPSAVLAFKDKLAGYKTSKGTVQFPLDEPIPYKLIEEIVKYRVRDIFTPS